MNQIGAISGIASTAGLHFRNKSNELQTGRQFQPLGLRCLSRNGERRIRINYSTVNGDLEYPP